MNISASGVLLRAARTVRNSANPHLEHPLQLLYGHLREVRRRHQAGESAAVLDEFFRIWTDLDQPSGLERDQKGSDVKTA